jgi:hypothetical protein
MKEGLILSEEGLVRRIDTPGLLQAEHENEEKFVLQPTEVRKPSPAPLPSLFTAA